MLFTVPGCVGLEGWCWGVVIGVGWPGMGGSHWVLWHSPSFIAVGEIIHMISILLIFESSPQY